jgi:hypothetical protein
VLILMHFMGRCKDEIGSYLGESGEVFIREHFESYALILLGCIVPTFLIRAALHLAWSQELLQPLRWNEFT